MFSRKFCLFLVTVALSSFIAQAAPAPCSDDGASAANHTVTVANRASTGGRSGSRTGNHGQNGFGSNNNTGSAGGRVNNQGGKNGKTNGTSASVPGKTQSASVTGVAAIASPTASSGNGNKGGNGSNTTSTGASGSSGASTANNTDSNPQTSLTLDPKVICTGFENNGQDVPTAGQVASLTSSDNFINFCLTSNLPLTNGSQVTGGSCNPAPMGLIPSVNNMPSAKFVFPPNFGTIQANTNFTVQMAIQGMETGFFVNAEQNYFAAPQQLNSQGQIQGHSHIVIEALSSFNQTTPTNPQKFAFFKGLNGAAQNGILTAVVAGGLPVGVYKVSSINTAANHQPVLVPIAQHGSLDDVVYFTVTANGNPASGSTGSTGSSSGSTTASTPSANNSTSVASASPSANTPAKGSNATKSVAAAGATGTGKSSGAGNGQKTNSGAGSASSSTNNSKSGRNGRNGN